MGWKVLRFNGEIIDIPEGSEVSRALGDRQTVWDTCGCLGFCFRCKMKQITDQGGCGRYYVYGTMKGAEENPFVRLPSGEEFYVDEIWEEPSMETDELKVVHWWPGREFSGDNPIPRHYLSEAKRMGTRYLTVAICGNLSAAAFCCPKDIPSRERGRAIALGRLKKGMDAI